MVAANGALPISRTVACATEGVYRIDPLCDPRWAAFVDSHPQASVFHSPNWLKALRAVYGYEPVAVTTCSPGTNLTNGFVFCRIKSWLTGRRMVSLPFSDHCEPLVESQDELDSILDQMKREVIVDDWKYIEIRPIRLEPSSRSELKRVTTYHLHNLDLGLSEERLFRNLHKDCVQRKIRRAERESLVYEEGASEDLLQKFYRLVVVTRRRQCLPPQPLSWFRGLSASFGKDLRIRVASKNGMPVASILTLSHRKSIVYKYGCSDAAFNNLGGTALLFWRAIQEAKDQGFEELELGRSEINNPGLVNFKEHLGGSGRLVNYWAYPQGSVGLPSVWREKVARHVVSAIPDFALEMIGTLLYKHIG